MSIWTSSCVTVATARITRHVQLKWVQSQIKWQYVTLSVKCMDWKTSGLWMHLSCPQSSVVGFGHFSSVANMIDYNWTCWFKYIFISQFRKSERTCDYAGRESSRYNTWKTCTAKVKGASLQATNIRNTEIIYQLKTCLPGARVYLRCLTPIPILNPMFFKASKLGVSISFSVHQCKWALVISQTPTS